MVASFVFALVLSGDALQTSTFESFHSATFSPFDKEKPELNADVSGLVKLLYANVTTMAIQGRLRHNWSVCFRSAPLGTPLDREQLPLEKGRVVCSNTVDTMPGSLEELRALVKVFREAFNPPPAVNESHASFRSREDPPLGWTAKRSENRIELTGFTLDLQETRRTGKYASMKQEAVIEKVSKEVVAELDKMLKAFEDRAKSGTYGAPK